MTPLRVTKENSTYQVLHALKTNRRKRRELREIFVEGVAAIKLGVQSGMQVKRIISQNGRSLSSWARRLIDSNRDAQYLELSKQLFNSLSDRSDPSELMVTLAVRDAPLSAVPASTTPFIVVIDRPTNHGNLGSIIRSANAFGVTHVVIVGHGVDVYDPAVIRASMGSVFSTSVHHIESMKSLVEWIAKMRQQYPELRVIATDSAGSSSLAAAAGLRLPAAILIGNEAKGLSLQLKQMADLLVRIPMVGAVDSLNVASAASIVMYQVWTSSLSHEGELPPVW